MKKITGFLCLLLCIASAMTSCNKGKTYGEMVEEEKDMIRQLIKDSSFVIIDKMPEDSIFAENEIMEFSDGLYMCILDKGNGRKFQNGDYITVRYTELNMKTGVKISNMSSSNQGTNPDVFRYSTNSNNSVQQGVLINENSNEYPLLTSVYNTRGVPAGWLIPLQYVGENGHVKIIVPHKLGHSDASYYVYPCYYEIKYGLSKR